MEELATARRAQGHPPHQIAAEIMALAGITRLWAWRLAYFDASAVAAEEAGDPALAAWVAERRGSRAGG